MGFCILEKLSQIGLRNPVHALAFGITLWNISGVRYMKHASS